MIIDFKTITVYDPIYDSIGERVVKNIGKWPIGDNTCLEEWIWELIMKFSEIKQSGPIRYILSKL